MRKLLLPLLTGRFVLGLAAPVQAQAPEPQAPAPVAMPNLVGSWQGETEVGGLAMTFRSEFRANGTFQSILKTTVSGFSSVVVARGKYKYSDGVLTTSGTIAVSGLGTIPFSEVSTLEWLDANRFTCTSGIDVTYSRKK